MRFVWLVIRLYLVSIKIRSPGENIKWYRRYTHISRTNGVRVLHRTRKYAGSSSAVRPCRRFRGHRLPPLPRNFRPSISTSFGEPPATARDGGGRAPGCGGGVGTRRIRGAGYVKYRQSWRPAAGVREAFARPRIFTRARTDCTPVVDHSSPGSAKTDRDDSSPCGRSVRFRQYLTNHRHCRQSQRFYGEFEFRVSGGLPAVTRRDVRPSNISRVWSSTILRISTK